MKDLDFDELDRAVNSLLGENNQPAPEANPVVELPSPDSVTAQAPMQTPSAPAAPVVSTPQNLVTRRSSGRFMDVVHPSSDMRGPTVPQRPATREALPVQPQINPVVAQTEPVKTEVPTQSWPDPLDFQAQSNELAAQPVNNEPQENDSDLSPLESPFIADAKVEKRPLGAFTDAEPLASSLDLANQPQESQQPASTAILDSERPINTDVPVPAELQDDLLSIESGEDTVSDAQPVEAIAQPIVTAASPVAPVSIPQQYVEQPSTGDQPAGSIFDTDAYHKPIAHPKKSKSGWMMLLWIFLLIILGVGAGAAFYFYALPLL